MEQEGQMGNERRARGLDSTKWSHTEQKHVTKLKVMMQVVRVQEVFHSYRMDHAEP